MVCTRLSPKQRIASASAAINLYDNADLRTKMGQAARQMVIDNFGRSSVTEKLTEFFRQIVGSHSSRPISQIPNPSTHWFC